MHSARLSIFSGRVIAYPPHRFKPAICSFALALLATAAFAQLKPTPLTGTWRITGWKRAGSSARSMSAPQPGLLIFTGNYYSRMLITSDDPRTALKDPAKATAAELLATWGPFNAASGTYEISGANLICRAPGCKKSAGDGPGSRPDILV